MNKTIGPVYDSNGLLIKLHDVLKDEETEEMAIVIESSNKSGVHGLAVSNKINGIGDWLDVYPDGVWTVVGNMGTGKLNN
jgi:hypothetical protein